jgi:hypothetical protein
MLNVREHLEDCAIDGWVLLKLNLNRMQGYGLGSSGSGHGPVTGTAEHGNQHLVSINGAFLCQLNILLLKINTAPRNCTYGSFF